MNHYSVVQTIQTTIPFSTEPPVDIPYYRGTDIGKAFSALLMAGQPNDDAAFTRVLSVRMDHTVVEEDANPEVDFVTVEGVILNLLSEQGENPEYDRACVEIARDLGIEVSTNLPENYEVDIFAAANQIVPDDYQM